MVLQKTRSKFIVKFLVYYRCHRSTRSITGVGYLSDSRSVKCLKERPVLSLMIVCACLFNLFHHLPVTAPPIPRLTSYTGPGRFDTITMPAYPDRWCISPEHIWSISQSLSDCRQTDAVDWYPWWRRHVATRRSRLPVSTTRLAPVQLAIHAFLISFVRARIPLWSSVNTLTPAQPDLPNRADFPDLRDLCRNTTISNFITSLL